ncbi:InlB B-repeat-containing protein [Slackia isoflavoniconvertens]|uniref:InlB B-repeat-containing protein n=1 Tax=Slackia isoflavoniconvertens TaxID=572010 RepID=UPI00248DA860|nr:InlB B-repeat-containing protein [Slackia isoflavoniconvertens]
MFLKEGYARKAVWGWCAFASLLFALAALALMPNSAFAQEDGGSSVSDEGAVAEAAVEPAAVAEAAEIGVAPAAAATITNARTGATYTDLATATAEAQSGDTIRLGEGNYTLYGVNSTGHTKGKDLTFEGLGADKTAWNIGAEVPNPDYYGTEYNGDYSFDGAGTVTFKNMTLRSGSANYLGFIRADKTVIDGCIVNGKTFYWGYSSAEFMNTTFNAPNGDYALWTYSSPTMTFDNCTFNASGKVINVYTDAGAGKHDIIVNVNNCTFNSNSGWFSKQALNINDSNMGSYKYILNITGNNTVTAKRDNTTCSQLFGFGGKASTNNTGRTDVTIDGELVWTAGKMQTHDYTDGEHDNAYDVTYTEWTSDDAGTWTRTATAKCNYCDYTKEPVEEKAFDLSYDLNGSEDEQTTDFATVECVTETEIAAGQPVRNGYSFAGWNTAEDGSGTSYAAGDKIELSTPVTLFAQWEKQASEPTVTPATPGDQAKPSANTGSNSAASQGGFAKTADAAALAIPVALVIAAGAATCMAFAARRRSNH